MNGRKAWIHCEDGSGFRVDLFTQWNGAEGQKVSSVWCRDESHANITAEAWEKEGVVR